MIVSNQPMMLGELDLRPEQSANERIRQIDQPIFFGCTAWQNGADKGVLSCFPQSFGCFPFLIFASYGCEHFLESRQ